MLTTEEVRAAFLYARNDQDYISPPQEEARFDAWLATITAGLDGKTFLLEAARATLAKRESALSRVAALHQINYIDLDKGSGDTAVCATCRSDEGEFIDYPCPTANAVSGDLPPSRHRKGLALGEIEVCETCPRNVYGAQIAWDDPWHLDLLAGDPEGGREDA